MSAVCQPTTSVIGQGTVEVQYLRQNSYQVETMHGGTQTNRFDVFRFTATPADGWQFDHWHISYSYDQGSHFGLPDETHETIYGEYDVYDTNPLETVDDYTLAVGVWDLIEEYYNTGRYGNTKKTLAYHVEAVFVEGGDSSSSDSSEDSSEEPPYPPGPDSSEDSSEEWEDGPLLYNPLTGHLRYNPETNHLRYKRRLLE